MTFKREHLDAIIKNYSTCRSRTEAKKFLKPFADHMKVDVENTAVVYGSSSDIISCPVVVFYIQTSEGDIDYYYYDDEQKKFVEYIDPPSVVPFNQVLYTLPNA